MHSFSEDSAPEETQKQNYIVCEATSEATIEAAWINSIIEEVDGEEDVNNDK